MKHIADHTKYYLVERQVIWWPRTEARWAFDTYNMMQQRYLTIGLILFSVKWQLELNAKSIGKLFEADFQQCAPYMSCSV